MAALAAPAAAWGYLWMSVDADVVVVEHPTHSAHNVGASLCACGICTGLPGADSDLRKFAAVCGRRVTVDPARRPQAASLVAPEASLSALSILAALALGLVLDCRLSNTGDESRWGD